MIKCRLRLEQLEQRDTPGAIVQIPAYAGAIELDIQTAQAHGLDQPPGQTASISGLVTHFGSGAPLSGVTITLTKESGSLATFTTTTNSDGAYSLSGLPPGVYGVTASLPGYDTQAVTVLEISVHNTSFDFTLHRGVGA
jgi:hypothetical protein